MGNVINKGEFVKAFAEKNGLSQNKANDTINAVLDSIKAELVAGNAVNFTGFGKFDVVNRAAREGRNPGTGEKIFIPATKAPRFSAGRTLKDAVK